jgi:hypothetical protein
MQLSLLKEPRSFATWLILVSVALLTPIAGQTAAQSLGACGPGLRLSAARPDCGQSDLVEVRWYGGEIDQAWGLLPLQLTSFYRTTAPIERDNGSRRAGRGLSGVLRAGVAGSWKQLPFAVEPEFTWSENRSFEIADTQLDDDLEYAYPWDGRRIDWPQRMGSDSRIAATLGRSFLDE